MTNPTRDAANRDIARNIRRHGFHLYVVQQSIVPRVSYTLGLSESVGAELALFGGACFRLKDVDDIFGVMRHCLDDARGWSAALEVEGKGTFTLRRMHSSWVERFMLGIASYYPLTDIASYQLVPDIAHWTMETPDASAPWSALGDPAWKWTSESWPYAVPGEVSVVTNLDALRGHRITEAARWGLEDWELFAGSGPDVHADEMRVVPLATLLGMDPTLVAVLNLDVGSALWRDDAGGDWNRWIRRAE